MMNNFISLYNNQITELNSIPVLNYNSFLEQNISLLEKEENHCINYFAVPAENKIKLFSCIANDSESVIYVFSTLVNDGEELSSLSNHNYAFSYFEREITENYNIKYADHPWLKPLRYSFNRFDKTKTIQNYPFYKIEGEELHQVGVGPIHAGIIEPGHFRFICKGEQILHLEIQLGYQHRGIEQLFLSSKNLLQKTLLAESIAGDTAVGHTTAFASLWEALCGFTPLEDIQIARSLALEIERIAIHTGDLSAICGDIAFQLGNAVFGRLRTPIINFFQSWCGNRIGKGLIRVGNNFYPLSDELIDSLLSILESYRTDFNDMIKEFFNNPGCLSRLEKAGVLSFEQAKSIGAVGMTAKASGLERDIRKSHPIYQYKTLNHQPIVKHHGDVFSRTQIRREEILQSIDHIKKILYNAKPLSATNNNLGNLKPNSFVVSLVEGWRGEICHTAITNSQNELLHYKIKDPSFHNWLALALAVRKNEISEFPICNKSFNLSYCGFDL